MKKIKKHQSVMQNLLGKYAQPTKLNKKQLGSEAAKRINVIACNDTQSHNRGVMTVMRLRNKSAMTEHVNNYSTVQPFNHSTAREVAFTLAEVLITMTILGIVAAMTIPNLIADYETRQYKTQATNFQRKLGEALRVMNAQNNLRGFSSTKEFVTELGKNFKIIKVCDTVTDCFTKKYVKKDGTSVDVSKLTTSASLGHGDFDSETVGVQFANGINAIVAYNKSFTGSEDSIKFSESTNGKTRTVTLTTNVISMLYDVNGYEKPNTSDEDIRGLNTNMGGKGDECVQVGAYCILDLGADYTPLACTTEAAATDNKDYCSISASGKPTGVANDYWAGAKKACQSKGMHLPSKVEATEIYGNGTLERYKGLVPTKNRYWTSDPNIYLDGNGSSYDFSNGSFGNSGGYSGVGNKFYVLCVK